MNECLKIRGSEGQFAAGMRYLGEAQAVLGHDAGVGTLQLLDDLEALVELRKDVHHGAGEERVLRRLLELRRRRRRRRLGAAPMEH